MRKNYKTSKHPNKIHIIQKYAKKLTFKNCVQIKKGRFAYLRWKIRNKNLQNTDADKPSVVVAGFVVGG
jgi:hypothetical protein